MKIKFYALCPVSGKSINERVARVNGFFTVFLLIVSGLTSSIIPVLFLVVDFFLRSFELSGFSLTAISAKGIVKYLGLDENIINAGPKIFAARMGFVMSSTIVILFLSHALLPAVALAVVLGLFSFLEAAFGLCIACEIYPYLYRLLYKVRFR
jgi:hypothetical protein